VLFQSSGSRDKGGKGGGALERAVYELVEQALGRGEGEGKGEGVPLEVLEGRLSRIVWTAGVLH